MIKIDIEKMLNGRSLYWLAKVAEVRWATLATMANGTARRIDLESLERISAALECQPKDLIVKTKRQKARKR